MVFYVSWIHNITRIPRGYRVWQPSDAGNRKMYLMDNLGNRYDHISVGGDAAHRNAVKVGTTVLRGWFVFPPPRPNATQFTFYDDQQGIAIRNLIFLPPTPTPPPTATQTPIKMATYMAP